MIIAVIGSRKLHISDIGSIIRILPLNCTQIISGGALGTDQLAEQIARQLELPFTCFMPDYEQYGKRAPLVRNLQIIDHADMVIALWD